MSSHVEIDPPFPAGLSVGFPTSLFDVSGGGTQQVGAERVVNLVRKLETLASVRELTASLGKAP